MSQEVVRRIIERLVSDKAFQQTLLKDAAAAVREGGYDVSKEELKAFQSLREEDLVGLPPKELEDRLSKMFFGPNAMLATLAK